MDQNRHPKKSHEEVAMILEIFASVVTGKLRVTGVSAVCAARGGGF